MRIGLIGAGAVAPFHVRAAAALAGAELTAVCDIDESAARRAADLSPGAGVFTDHRRMLEADVVDAVIVNTPHALHLPISVEAAEAGKHVLVEKPMATSVADCDRIAEACERAGVSLTVGHIQHFLPDKTAAHGLIASGELGAVQLIRDNRSTDYRPGTRSPWFFSREVAGGGALFNIGAHCLDRSLWFGGAPAAEISASVASRFGSPVETDGVLRLRLENGVGVAIAVVSDPPTRSDSLTVVCEGGVVEADPRTGTTVRIDGRTRVLHEPTDHDIQTGFTAQLSDFLQVVDGGPPAVPLDHARHVVELILASYRSAQTGVASVLGAVPA
ncbi:Gfo/Idh/MocA family protein [Microbacterium sp. NPDC057659]|uniref:Gfo/Idh/MocA family protein n=1 Tax=Microbacterium sp. NPDC057659 TaxID=3346198 RepID=UPI0036711CED